MIYSTASPVDSMELVDWLNTLELNEVRWCNDQDTGSGVQLFLGTKTARYKTLWKRLLRERPSSLDLCNITASFDNMLERKGRKLWVAYAQAHGGMPIDQLKRNQMVMSGNRLVFCEKKSDITQPAMPAMPSSSQVSAAVSAAAAQVPAANSMSSQVKPERPAATSVSSQVKPERPVEWCGFHIRKYKLKPEYLATVQKWLESIGVTCLRWCQDQPDRMVGKEGTQLFAYKQGATQSWWSSVMEPSAFPAYIRQYNICPRFTQDAASNSKEPLWMQYSNKYHGRAMMELQGHGSDEPNQWSPGAAHNG